MEFVKAMEIKERMCKYYMGTESCCTNCELSFTKNDNSMVCSQLLLENPKECEAILEKWEKKHPQKTILSEFLEHYPNAELNGRGFPTICPQKLGYKASCEYVGCQACWHQPIKAADDK